MLTHSPHRTSRLLGAKSRRSRCLSQTATIDPKPPFVAGDDIGRPPLTGQPTRSPAGPRSGKRRSLGPKR